MDFDDTAQRLWKRLTREERMAAGRHFFAEPPQEVYGTAVGVIARARHLRPQVARSMTPDELARALALVLDVGEPLASSLLVALHLGERREILATFLDAIGLPHEAGVLKDEADDPAPDAARLAAGVEALRARFTAHEARTYLNALWLQDPERWAALRELPEIG
jgi:hypothetical protein